jgi:hypothetical protein
VEMPSMNIVSTPITTSGKPTPYAGPAAHGEAFSGKKYPHCLQRAALSRTRLSQRGQVFFGKAARHRITRGLSYIAWAATTTIGSSSRAGCRSPRPGGQPDLAR